MQTVAMVLATLVPLVVLYVIYALDLFKMGAFRSVLLCFANYEYIVAIALASPGAGLGTAISQVLSTNLIHASATALMGVTLGLAGVGFIALLIFRGLAEQRQWIEEKLGTADRVTAGEARIVHRLDDLPEILKSLRQVFGDQKGDQIEQLLMIQARGASCGGILRAHHRPPRHGRHEPLRQPGPALVRKVCQRAWRGSIIHPPKNVVR